MKYFNPSYWFKLWLLSAPLFNDKTQGINAKSIDNKKIKDWVSNNTGLESIDEPNSFTNTSINYQPYNLNETNQNIDPIYQKELETSTHKHRHEKSRNRHKRQPRNNNEWAINVNIPLFSQENVVWCAIATSEAILRNLGLNINNFLDRINLSREGAGLTEYSSFQHYLSERMNVEYLRNENNEIIGGGVYSENVVNIINDIITSENIQTQPYTIQFFHAPRYFGLQTTADNIPGNTVDEAIRNQWNHLSETLNIARSIRQLEEQLGIQNANIEEANRRINEQIQANIEINFRDTFFRNLDSLVRSSLQNNMPLIFGQGFQPTYRAYGGYAGHSILIVSTSSNGHDPQEDLSNIRYRVIDPGTGQYAIYTARDLYYAGGDVFSLISSNSNNLQLQNIGIYFANFPNNNQGNNARFLQEIVRPALNNFLLFSFI
ncbi:hypothetical protein [Spiroplasma endosymbiont of Zeiraphera isertana]|uniref:hypothetical protein n=1 Tax=Spiroplasma endosymbiont of Zeiraphera isertana TaxID=3066313 RepID=UPI00313AD4A9